jgi:hypothetical protein
VFDIPCGQVDLQFVDMSRIDFSPIPGLATKVIEPTVLDGVLRAMTGPCKNMTNV